MQFQFFLFWFFNWLLYAIVESWDALKDNDGICEMWSPLLDPTLQQALLKLLSDKDNSYDYKYSLGHQ